MPVIKPQTNKYYNKIPESPFLRQTIDQIAKYVAKHGIIFEYVIFVVVFIRLVAFKTREGKPNIPIYL